MNSHRSQRQVDCSLLLPCCSSRAAFRDESEVWFRAHWQNSVTSDPAGRPVSGVGVKRKRCARETNPAGRSSSLGPNTAQRNTDRGRPGTSPVRTWGRSSKCQTCELGVSAMWTKHVSVTANQTGHDPLSLKSENYLSTCVMGLRVIDAHKPT